MYGCMQPLAQTAHPAIVLVRQNRVWLVLFFQFGAIILALPMSVHFFFRYLAFEQYFTYLLDRDDLKRKNKDEERCYQGSQELQNNIKLPLLAHPGHY